MLKNTLAAAAVISFLCACSHTRTITTKDGSATVSVGEGKDGAASVHAIGKDGSTVDFNTGKAITDYPSDVPLYANAKSAMDVKSGEKHARMLVLQSPDAMDKISGFYKSELESKGWKIETTMNTEQMVMYKASKDNRDVVVQLAGGGKNNTTITQTVGDKN
jgi:hypothetical protein